MRGHVHKRGKTWTVVYDEQAGDAKRRQRTKGGFATKRDAQRFLTDTLARMERGSYAAPSKLTVADYLTGEWLPAVHGTLRPLSHDRYARVVRLYIKPQIGATRLQALSGGHLNAMYAGLEASGLSVSTVRLVHAVLSRALRAAERWGRVPRNVARMADPPARGRSRAQAWTAGELRRFLEHVQDDRLFPLWRLAATTGMRRGELAGLTWRWLDLDAARLSVEQQLVPTRGGCTFGPPKSARSRRTVALYVETVDVLRAHREAQILARASPGTPTSTPTSCSPTSSAGGSTRSDSRNGSANIARPPASRPAPCTCYATRPPRWRSRPVCRCTSWPPGSATTRRPCCRRTRTCCRSRTSSRPSGWRARLRDRALAPR
jgi:integrase